MNRKPKNASGITPEECLERLPDLPFIPAEMIDRETWEQTELRQSLLKITKMDHENETAMVKKAAKNAVGSLPSLEG